MGNRTCETGPNWCFSVADDYSAALSAPPPPKGFFTLAGLSLFARVITNMAFLSDCCYPDEQRFGTRFPKSAAKKRRVNFFISAELVGWQRCWLLLRNMQIELVFALQLEFKTSLGIIVLDSVCWPLQCSVHTTDSVFSFFRSHCFFCFFFNSCGATEAKSEAFVLVGVVVSSQPLTR